jgi:hypothetical protein
MLGKHVVVGTDLPNHFFTPSENEKTINVVLGKHVVVG